MIRRAVSYTDSAGRHHSTREAAVKSEFRIVLRKHFPRKRSFTVDDLAEHMMVIDKIIGEASKEDTRFEYATKLPPEVRKAA